MTVHELIVKLQTFNLEANVICHCQDAEIPPTHSSFTLFEVSGVRAVRAAKVRVADDKPSLRFGEGQGSEPHVLIDITSDF